jgi:hypothetical protein
MAAKNQALNAITGNAQDTNYPGGNPVWQQMDNLAYTNLLGIQKPEVLDMLVDTSNNKKDVEYYMMVMALGGEKTTPNNNYLHYYDTRLWETVLLSYTSGGGAGAPTVYTIQPGSLFGSAYQYFPQLGQVLKFANGTLAQILIIGGIPSAPTLSVTPLNSELSCPTTYVNVPTNVGWIAASEASPSNYTSIVDNLYTYANTVGIIDSPFQVTGDQLSNDGFYISDSPDYDRIMKNWQIRHMKAISLHCLNGQQNTNSVADPINPTYNTQSTNGLLTDFAQLANQYAYTPGSFQMTDWENCNRILVQARAEEDVLMLMGYNVFASTQKTLASYFSATGGNQKAVQDMTTMKFFGDWGTHESQSIASSINFKSIDYLGFKWHFKMMDTFNDDTTFAATGYPGYDLFLALPFNKKQMVPLKGGGQEAMPSLMIRYKANSRYSRKYNIVGVDGTGFSGSFMGSIADYQNKLIRTQGGNHVLSAQQGIYGRPTGSTF